MDRELLSQVEEKMIRAISSLQEDLATIRTGRATSALVENVVISAYENTQHLKVKEMATITTEGPRALIISPFDPSVIRDIERGINAANLDITGVAKGNVVRVNIPPLSQERREQYIKLAGVKIEGGRVMVRQIRREVMSQLKRKFEAKEISEDERKRMEKEVQSLTDKKMTEIELLREKKEKELEEI